VCCEAAGIHVLWAPVKNPQFKAYVERAFLTLQELVWNRLDEGIPFKPTEMSQFGLDPMVKAAHTREWLSEKMWEAIVTLYHVEKHDGIDMAPARKWSEGLARAGRKTVDDVRALDKILGRSQTCLLTAEGITLNKNRDPSANGAAAPDVPSTMPAAEREGDRIPDPAPRRGGAKATAKANRNRDRSQARKRRREVTRTQPQQSKEIRVAAPTMAPADSASRLAKLAADLD
jgi:hypothetical protein